jgi:hypothetical protein
MSDVRSQRDSLDLKLTDLFQTYSCTFLDCGKVFLRAYELKKHKATHEDPDRYVWVSR